ncbi:hypothetical protein [Streptomyces venezuelae]|nr:hypothetical protein [Streptomyces venezuelae]
MTAARSCAFAGQKKTGGDVCVGAVVGALRPLLAEDPAPDWP